MKKEEKELFKSLCSFKETSFDEALLGFATPNVLGQLFFNRMAAIAYGTLKNHGFLGKVNREFRNSLKGAYELNVEKNKSFFQCVQYVTDILSEVDCPYALLKGACLCRYYPDGYRTSNDIDLLVHPEDVTKIGNTLAGAGFVQGYIRNGVFVPASRKEIIESKMMRGETVPYIKEISLPGMPFLEADVNFSLDYKPGDTFILNEMLTGISEREVNGLRLQTLNEEDFLIHLCSHLYKEATTLPWVEMMRDMTLYKYADIYLLLSDAGEEKIEKFFSRAEWLGTEKLCAFAILQCSELFNFHNHYAIKKAKTVLKEDPQYLHTVVSPKERKTYVFWEKDISERFFANSRKKLLREVKTL